MLWKIKRKEILNLRGKDTMENCRPNSMNIEVWSKQISVALCPFSTIGQVEELEFKDLSLSPNSVHLA